MDSAHAFLQALTIVLCVAGVTTVVFQRLRQPVVLGYIIAGLMIGPQVPVPPVANREIVQTLSELTVNAKESSCAHLPQETTEFEVMVPCQ